MYIAYIIIYAAYGVYGQFHIKGASRKNWNFTQFFSKYCQIFIWNIFYFNKGCMGKQQTKFYKV